MQTNQWQVAHDCIHSYPAAVVAHHSRREVLAAAAAVVVVHHSNHQQLRRPAREAVLTDRKRRRKAVEAAVGRAAEAASERVEAALVAVQRMRCQQLMAGSPLLTLASCRTVRGR